MRMCEEGNSTGVQLRRFIDILESWTQCQCVVTMMACDRDSLFSTMYCVRRPCSIWQANPDGASVTVHKDNDVVQQKVHCYRPCVGVYCCTVLGQSGVDVLAFFIVEACRAPKID